MMFSSSSSLFGHHHHHDDKHLSTFFFPKACEIFCRWSLQKEEKEEKFYFYSQKL